jgi:mannan endo-1,4-beta-mannosidase
VLGTNLYYLQSYSVYEAGNLRTVADGLDDAVRMSLPVVRTWAFNDSKDTNDSATIRSAPGTYLERGLVGLDTVVAEAKKRGIRLIMTLSNYWDAYGGFPRYATWAGASGADDFYTNTTMQGYLKDYATKLSQRVNTLTGIAYKDEPTILAWEIANEMRCKACTDASAPTAVIDSLSKFLKTVFPNHLIADGGEGFDDTPSNWGPLSNTYPVSGYEHVSYSKIAQLSALDMLSYHYYPDPNYWNLTITDSATVASDAKTWVDGHAALAKAANKVAYWGEFGIDGTMSTTDRDAARAPAYDSWLSSFFATTDNNPVVTFWQLIPQSRGADDGFACILGRDPNTVAVFEKYSQPRAPRGN